MINSQGGYVLKLSSDVASRSEVEEIGYSAVGQWLFLLGGLALLVGPLMPWLELLGATTVSATGIDRTGGEAILMVALGFAVAVSACVSLWRGKDQTMMVPFFLGLTGAVMAFMYYRNLRASIAAVELESYQVAVGQGLYICLAGGLMIASGLIIAELQRHERLTASACHP